MDLRRILLRVVIVLGCSRESARRELVSHPPSSTVRAQKPTTAVVTILRAGALVDVDTGALLRDQLVSIDDDGRIQDVGADIKVPADARVIDLSDFTILPGLFDAHTHLCSDFHPHWNGFTTVRDLGNAGDYADVDLRQGIDRDVVIGPTMIPAGRIIALYGGQSGWRVRKDVLLDPEYMFADTRDELRKAIRENIFYGAAVIKILADGQPYAYSEADIAFIVEEAADAGRKVAAHCQTRDGVKRALAAGVASIEHGWEMTDADFEVARKKASPWSARTSPCPC